MIFMPHRWIIKSIFQTKLAFQCYLMNVRMMGKSLRAKYKTVHRINAILLQKNLMHKCMCAFDTIFLSCKLPLLLYAISSKWRLIIYLFRHLLNQTDKTIIKKKLRICSRKHWKPIFPINSTILIDSFDMWKMVNVNEYFSTTDLLLVKWNKVNVRRTFHLVIWFVIFNSWRNSSNILRLPEARTPFRLPLLLNFFCTHKQNCSVNRELGVSEWMLSIAANTLAYHTYFR